MALLEIRDLHATAGGTEILKGITLSVDAGEVHAIMGPNGSGKSTLAQVLAGHPAYAVTSGTVTFAGADLLDMEAEERAHAGVFLAFQYPVEIPGVTNAYFLRASYNAVRKARGLEELDPMEFLDLLEERLKIVEWGPEIMERAVNFGFSGGEKKRNEILQMAVLEPKLAVLDETDSGLDIDALRIVAKGVNALRRPESATLLVTHYQRLLDYIVPDQVHVLAGGRIVKSGGKELAHELEARGYEWLADGGGGEVTATLDPVPFADLAARSQERELTDSCGTGMREARDAAFARFAAVGIPTTKDEEWRFTPVRHLGSTRFAAPAESPQLAESDIAPFLVGTPEYRVVVVDGRVDATLSRLGSAGGLRVAALSGAGDSGLPSMSCAGDRATITTTPFAALNAALWTDGAALHVAEGHIIETPIEVIHVATVSAADAVVTPRTVIFVGRKARATIVESFVSLTSEPYFTNAACEIVMDEGSRLEHARIQREGPAATHIGLTTVHQAGESHYRSFTLALGAKLSRHNLHAHLDAPNVETLLYGLYIGRGEQLLDNHTAIFHDHPDCNSWEVYKGVLAGRSHGVFNGKVIVQPAAQKTDAKQTNRNLLLSDTAKVDTKPQLEIFADDVRCTHGATVGKLNEQQRFYLRTRGIAGRAAELMLITAFVAEVVAEVTHPRLREVLDGMVRAEIDALVG